jgi:hypothetical protein
MNHQNILNVSLGLSIFFLSLHIHIHPALGAGACQNMLYFILEYLLKSIFKLCFHIINIHGLSLDIRNDTTTYLLLYKGFSSGR